MQGTVLAAGSILFYLKIIFVRAELKTHEQNIAPVERKYWTEKRYWYLGIMYAGISFLVFLLWKKKLIFFQYADLWIVYLLLSIVDIKKHMIPDRVLICMGISQLLYGMETFSVKNLFCGALTGIVVYVILLFISIVSRGGLGLGDAKLLALTAVFTGGSYLLQMIFWGLVCAFVYSIFLLAHKKGNRKTELPFVPFLACGMLIHIGIWMI